MRNLGEESFTVETVEITGAHEDDFRIVGHTCDEAVIDPPPSNCTVTADFRKDAAREIEAQLGKIALIEDQLEDRRGRIRKLDDQNDGPLRRELELVERQLARKTRLPAELAQKSIG